MNLEWTKHLKTDQEKKDFEDLLKRNTIISRRIREIIEAKVDQLNRQDISDKDFETSDWAYKQAKRIGMRKAYNEIYDLFDFNKRIITLDG